MKVGGKFYLAHAQQQKRFSYSKQLSRRAVQAHQQSVQFFSQALFDANVVHSQERVRLTIQQFAGRVSSEMQSRFDSYDQLKTNVSSLQSEGRKLDLLV